MEQENYENNNDRNIESVFSSRVRAGKRRTYFFDVRETRGSDYYLTITESRKRFDSDGYDRHKIFLYKEDFKKFMDGLNDSTSYIKEQLPDYDFDNPPQREYIDHGANQEGHDGAENTQTGTDDITLG